MKLSKMIKRDSKMLLADNFGKGVGIVVIIGIINTVINLVNAIAFNLCGYDMVRMSGAIFEFSGNIFMYSGELFTSPIPFLISFLGMIVKLLLITPIIIGSVNFYLNITDKNKVNVSDIFLPYEGKLFGKSIWLNINLTIKRFLITLLFVALPSVLMTVSLFLSAKDNIPYFFAPMLLIVSSVMLIVAVLFAQLFMQRYALADILICDKYGYSVHKAIKTSIKYMMGYKGQLFSFRLSYILLLIPMLVIFVIYSLFDTPHLFISPLQALFFVVSLITLLLVIPYYQMGTTMYKRYLFELGEHINKVNEVAMNTSPAIEVKSETVETNRVDKENKAEEKQETVEPKIEEPTVIEAFVVSEDTSTDNSTEISSDENDSATQE